MSPRWTHVTITVSDMERSIAFYTSLCGLAVVRDRRKEGGGTVWLGSPTTPRDRPNFVLVLTQGVVTARIDHFGFECGSRAEVDAIADAARRGGFLESPPRDSGGTIGYWTIVKDPDGHGVEFTHGQPIAGL